MTGNERFGALMEGLLPDRVPVVCNLLEQGADEMGLSIKEYYSSGETVAEGQIRMQEKYGYDNVWAFHYTAADVEMLGSSFTVFADDGPPNVGELIIQSEADIRNLVIDESLLENQAWRELIKTLDILKREKGDVCPILGSVVGTFSMPPILMGMDKWLDLLYSGDEALISLLLEKCSDFCIMKTRALFEAGVGMIAYSNPMATVSFITVQQFKRMALPWIKRDFEGAGPYAAGLVYFNGGGVLNPMIPTLVEEIDAGAYYLNPKDDIREARRIIGSRGLCAAPINDMELITSSRERIDKEVKRIMEEGAPDGGFIFGTLVMPYLIPEENIRYMIEAAVKYGQY